MKKSYIKILIFELVIFSVLILNSFNSSILSNYRMPSFLFILIIVFKFLLGFERDKFRYKKDLIINIVIDSLIYYIIYYLLGLIIGFAYNDNYLTIYGISKFIIPLLITIVLKEILRYGILRKCGNKIKLIILTTILFIFLDISMLISITNFNSSYGILVFCGISLLPSISKNIFLSYLSYKEGFKPGIVYSLIMEIPALLLTIIPNPSIYLKSVIDFVIPAIFLITVINFYKKSLIVNDVDRDYKKQRRGLIIFPLLLTMILVYFVSGYFKYYAIAVASGSMRPIFDRGSVVIVDQKYEKLDKGMIIAFKANKKIVVHRIVNIVKYEDEIYYYTKGDANKVEDDYKLTKKDIIGVVNYKIPYIGYPTVWLSEL